MLWYRAMAVVAAIALIAMLCLPFSAISFIGDNAVLLDESATLSMTYFRGNVSYSRPKIPWVTGHSGKAIYLNGENAFLQANGPLPATNELTVSLWVNLSATPAVEDNAGLISITGEDEENTFLVFSPNDYASNETISIHGAMLRLKAPGYNFAIGRTVNDSGLSPLNPGWHHIAIAWSDAALQFYVDGVCWATRDTVIGPHAFAPKKLVIGRNLRPGIQGGYCQCAVDQVTVYNRHLLQSEIATLCGDIPKPTNTTTLATTTAPTTTRYQPSTPADPHQPDNQLWLLSIPIGAIFLVVLTCFGRRNIQQTEDPENAVEDIFYEDETVKTYFEKDVLMYDPPKNKRE